MMRKATQVFILLSIGLTVLLVVAGCSSGDEESPDPEQPEAEAFIPPTAEAGEVSPSPTIAQLTDAETDETEVEATPEPEPTPTIVATATAPLPDLQAEAQTNLNLRRGPGTSYEIVGRLAAEEEVPVVGRNEDSSWLLIEKDGEEAWLIADPELITVDNNLLADMPIVDSPFLAYNPNNENISRLLNQVPLVIYHDGSHTCASHGGLNNLIDVANGNVIGPHSGDFVMGTDNVLFEYSNGDVRLIKENSIARFDNGEKYLSFEDTMKLFEREEIIWTGSFGEWPARGVTGCDPAAGP